MGRLRRFLHLEQARTPTSTGPATRDNSRIERVAPGGQAGPPAPSPATAPTDDDAPKPSAVADRFAPPPETAAANLEVDTRERRPFTRCLGCGAENGQYASRCSDCGAPLDTAAVRRLNARLWAAEKAQKAEEDLARRTAAEAEAAALSAEIRARKAEQVDAAFAAIVAEERARDRRDWLDRAADYASTTWRPGWSAATIQTAIVIALLVIVAVLLPFSVWPARVVQFVIVAALASVVFARTGPKAGTRTPRASKQ